MIKVLRAGIYNTIQDQGRPGYAKSGIPVSGVMDAYAARMANTLMRNQANDALIEISMGQGEFQFLEKTAFCLTGGDFSAKLDGEPIKTNRIYEGEANSIVSFGKRNYGSISYLAVHGGIQSEVIFGSRSFSKGITHDRLEKGDVLGFSQKRELTEQGFARIGMWEEHYNSPTLTCFAGPEFDRLNEKQRHRLFSPFTLSKDRNRAGYQLAQPLENNLKPILTSAVMTGTVQLTPSGRLIALMRESQVTGGYPRVLQLSEEAISVLSQKVAGDEMRFELQSC